MQLLVSVSSAAEASAALLGGADIVDAKDPLGGSLGAVAEPVFREIVQRVDGLRPVTAALGDAWDDAQLERLALRFAASGPAFVKIGFAGVTDAVRIRALLAAATRGVRACDGPSAVAAGIIAVAYADAAGASTLPPRALLDAAADASVAGVLLDTFDKAGPGLCELMTTGTIARWIAAAHEAGLIAAFAGKLTASQLPAIRDLGADIAGVRGAACEGGRNGLVVVDNVRELRALCSGGGDVNVTMLERENGRT
jgi:uncharacterized protein (UPF0264 family)